MKPLIRAIQPTLHLSGDIDKLLDQIAKPSAEMLTYDFVVNLSMEQILILLGWIVETKVVERESQAIEDGKSKLPAQLMIEFTRAVEAIMKQ